MTRTSWIVTGAVAVMAVAVSGCGQSAVGREEVADVVSTKLEKQVGERPDSVACPKDLPAEVGSSIRCTLTEGGQSLGVTVRVTSVDDGVEFTAEVDQPPGGQ